jgi:hypothetical protein
VTIDRIDPPEFKPRQDGPPLLALQKTALSCGCTVFLGRLGPELERPGVLSEACSDAAHASLIAHFRLLWADEQHKPGWADVTAERLLRKAEGLYEARRSVERAVGSRCAARKSLPAPNRSTAPSRPV